MCSSSCAPTGRCATANPTIIPTRTHDRRCTERLVELMLASDRVIADLAAILPRMYRYSVRLHDAAGCVDRGENNRFTGVMCESFHDIWMELHEDLIVMLRIDRVAEGSF